MIRSLEIELNSYESTASTAKAGTAFDGAQASLAIQTLSSALNILAGASSARTAAVAGAISTDNIELKSATSSVNDTFRQVSRCVCIYFI